MRVWVASLSLLIAAGCSGCVAVAVASAASAIAITTVKATGKVTAATVATTGRVASAAMTSSGDVTVLTLETAARLARTGMVVMLDGSNGALVEVPWREGLRLYQAARAGGLSTGYDAARIFRDGRMITTAFEKTGRANVALRSGDVVELRR